jgi:hypothetical protein
MNPVYIGVDPGAGGALALLRHLHSLGGTTAVQIQVVDMPTHEINGKRRIDLHALVRQCGSGRWSTATCRRWSRT